VSRVALSLFALVLALLAAALALGIGVESAFDLVGWHLLAAVLATLGLLVASRHPANPVGWLFLALAVVQGVSELGQAYAERAARSDLPAGEIAEWLNSWIWVLQPTLMGLVLLLFPAGRLPSRRWRLVPVLALSGCTLAMASFALSPWDPQDSAAYPENPFAVESPVVDVLALGFALLVITLLAGAASLVVRFRRARGAERQQLKWIASAASIGPLIAVIGAWFWPAWQAQAATLLGSALIPIAAGIAILRHRLYDIDVVINRALVYGALTATLAGVYLGSVLLLQLLLAPLTASSKLAIVVSTLAVAALFQPARRRFQAIVDRRFYRSKYDAARTLERFGAQLRDEVDLDALGDELRAVVAETMQPAHISLWLRDPQATR